MHFAYRVRFWVPLPSKKEYSGIQEGLGTRSKIDRGVEYIQCKNQVSQGSSA